MTSQHTFSPSDFPNGKISEDILKTAIHVAIPEKLGSLFVDSGGLTIDFNDDLTPEEEGKLANVIGQHTGEVLPTEIVARPTWEHTDGLNPKWTSYLYTTVPGSVNIFDEKITSEIVLRGGGYQIFNDAAEFGDYVELSMMDKDDTLGLFSAYGLTPGQPGHVIELTKYVVKDYIVPSVKGFTRAFEVNGGRDVMEGLYLRTTYVSRGTAPVQLAARVKNYE